jgi:hypothetical protein
MVELVQRLLLLLLSHRARLLLLLLLSLSSLLLLLWPASELRLSVRQTSSSFDVVNREFISNYVASYPENEMSETARFLAAKEADYRVRRTAVESVCQSVADPSFGSTIRKNALVWDPVHRVSYCQIPKARIDITCVFFKK